MRALPPASVAWPTGRTRRRRHDVDPALAERAPTATTVERLSAAFNRCFETLDAGDDVFAPDAFFDLFPPFWRFQLAGARRPSPRSCARSPTVRSSVRVLRVVPTATGFVLEHEETSTARRRTVARRLWLCEVRDGRITEVVGYCNGGLGRRAAGPARRRGPDGAAVTGRRRGHDHRADRARRHRRASWTRARRSRPTIAARAAEIEAARRAAARPARRADRRRLLPAAAAAQPRRRSAPTCPTRCGSSRRWPGPTRSVGWTVMIGGGSWIDLAGLPRATFDALFADGRDVIVAGVVQPDRVDRARATAATGSPAGGASPAAASTPTWLFGNCVEGVVDGVPQLRIAVFAPDEVAIEDTWTRVRAVRHRQPPLPRRRRRRPGRADLRPLVDEPCLDEPIVRIPPPALSRAGDRRRGARHRAGGARRHPRRSPRRRCRCSPRRRWPPTRCSSTSSPTADTELRAARALLSDTAETAWAAAVDAAVHPGAAGARPRRRPSGRPPGPRRSSRSPTAPAAAARSTPTARCSAACATSTPSPSTSSSSRTR